MIGRVNTGGGGSPNKSTIIVTAPTGSTVTCKMGSTTKTATEKNGVWTFGGLDLGTWTITSTKGGDSATQDVVITRLTVEYVTIVYRITPEFTYTGDYAIVDDSDNPISDFASWKGNWKIRFLTSGTLTFTKLNGWNGQLDVFLVGGGGSGAVAAWQNGDGCGGGAGGYTKTVKAVTVTVGVAYPIVVGAGGNRATPDSNLGKKGGDTSAFGISASGGEGGGNYAGGAGGSGGGAGTWGNNHTAGDGGSDGSDGENAAHDSGTFIGGKGQGTTTREFGESSGNLYAGAGGGAFHGGGTSGTSGTSGSGGAGGGGDGSKNIGTDGTTNTGGGGGGSGKAAASGDVGSAGGSGIVIARNARRAA